MSPQIIHLNHQKITYFRHYVPWTKIPYDIKKSMLFFHSDLLHIFSRSSQKKKKRQTQTVSSQNSSNDSLDNFDERKPPFEIEYSSSQDSSTNNSELPDSPIVGNYGSSDEDRIVDLMKRTAFSSQGPGFESRYRTYENLSLLPWNSKNIMRNRQLFPSEFMMIPRPFYQLEKLMYLSCLLH